MLDSCNITVFFRISSRPLFLCLGIDYFFPGWVVPVALKISVYSLIVAIINLFFYVNGASLLGNASFFLVLLYTYAKT